jgi:hypothetical protein
MICPLRGGISPTDFFLSESFFSLSVFCPTEAAKYFSDRSPCLRFLGR